jgi:hypothetical protein
MLLQLCAKTVICTICETIDCARRSRSASAAIERVNLSTVEISELTFSRVPLHDVNIGNAAESARKFHRHALDTGPRLDVCGVARKQQDTTSMRVARRQARRIHEGICIERRLEQAWILPVRRTQ